MSKLTNVSGRDLYVNSRRGFPKGGLRVTSGQALDVVKEALDVGDAYQVGDRLYPKKHWALVQPVKKESSGKAEGAEPTSEKE